jgi:hypothetical protein
MLVAALLCVFGGSARQAWAVNDVCGGDVLPVVTPFQESCTYPDGEQATFTVPAGVSTLHVVGVGAPGQKGEDGANFDTITCTPTTTAGGIGGDGMTISGDVTIVPEGGTISNDHTVATDDQLQVYVDGGPYVGGSGGHGNHSEITTCLGSPVQAPITSGNGGDGGGAAVLTDTDIPSGQTRLDMVAPGGGGGGGGGSTVQYAGGFAGGHPGAAGGFATGNVPSDLQGAAPLKICVTTCSSGDDVLNENGNGDVLGGQVGACVLQLVMLASTVGCPGGAGAAGISGGFMGAGGGGGGAGRNGGAGGQAGYENCTPFCTVIGEAGGGGGAGANRVPGGWVASSNLTDPASLTISWVNNLRPTTGISLIPDPDGANGWYVHPPTFVDVVAGELGDPVTVFCDLDPDAPPSSIADFAGLPTGHGPGCDATSLSADTADGTHTLYAISEDSVGATSDIVSKTWSIDTHAPTLTNQLVGLTNADGSFWTDATVGGCANDGNGSGIDTSKTPGTTDGGDGDKCVFQTLHYVDGAIASSSPVTFYDIAGNQVTSGPQTVRFRQNSAHDILLGGDCGLGPVCAVPGLLTANEGGSVDLVGDVEGPPNDNGSLTIDWGDGSPPTTAAYPCAQGDPSCPFQAVTGPPQATGFGFHHTYANNPPGGTHYTITVSNTEPVSPTPTTATTTATVSNVAPTIALEGDCALCVNPTGSALTVANGAPVKLAGQVTDPGTDTGTVSIDWGDGSPQTVVPFDCATPGELCPTPAQQNYACGSLSFDARCGYFSDLEHTYAHPGAFTITATATDQDGGTSSKSTTATVNAAPPALTIEPDCASCVNPTGSILNATSGQPIRLSGLVTDAESASGSVTIDWGDGGAGDLILFNCSGGLCASPSQQPTGCGATRFDQPCGYFTAAQTYAAPGTYTITVKANDPFATTTKTVQAVVSALASQAITVDTHAPSSAAYNATFVVAAHGGASGNPVTYSSSGACSNTGSTFTMTAGTGTCAAMYDQAGNGTYNAAPEVTETVSATKAAQSITVTTHAPATALSGSTFTVAATGGGSGNPVTFSSSGSCTNGGSATFTVTGAGTCSVLYDQAGDGNYSAAPEVTETVTTTTMLDQAITVTTHAPSSATYGASFTVAATGGGSGNPVTFSSSGACSNGGPVFTMMSGSGTCTVKYDQAGNGTYTAAPEVTETVSATKAAQSITVTQHAPSTAIAGSTFTVAATGGGSGNPVTFSSSGSCTNGGSATFTVTGAGTCSVLYDQAGDGNYSAAPEVTETVATTVMLDQAISVTTHAPSSAVFGTSFTVAATGGGSGNPVTFSAGGSCSQSGSTFTMTSGTGTCTVKYDQAGNANYNAAPEVTETVNAQQASQAITVTTHAPSSAAFGAGFSVAATGGASGNPIVFSSSGACSNTGAVFTMTSGTGTCTVKYDQAGNGNYAAAPEVTESVTAGKASQSITFGTIAGKTYGDADFDPGATASSGLVVGYGVTGNCSIVSGKVHITGVGSCSVTASQAGNGNYTAATSVAQSFTIGQAATGTSVIVSAKGSNPTPQFSDTVTVSATVAPAATATGNGVFSGTLSFQVNGRPSPALTRPVSNTAPTQSVDVRLDSAVIPNGAGSYSIAVTFTPAAGGNYAGSSKTQSQAVMQEGENADTSLDGSTQLSSDGDQYVIIGGAGPNMVGTLSQSQAPETTDSEYVDFSKANVYEVFTIYPASSTTPAWTSGNMKVQNRSDWSSAGAGVAQVSGPKNLAAGTYIVDVALVADGFIVAEDATSTLDVASASGTFIAGAGQTSPDSTSNSGNKRGRFAVNVLDVKNIPLGSVSYVYRMRMNISASTTSNIVTCTSLNSNCRDVDITISGTKVTALNTGTVSNGYPRSGYVTGRANVQFVDAANHHHYSQFEFTNGTFRVDVTDKGVGGSTDTFGFTAYRNGSVFHQAHTGSIAQSGTGSAANQTQAVNGNVFVHPK